MSQHSTISLIKTFYIELWSCWTRLEEEDGIGSRKTKNSRRLTPIHSLTHPTLNLEQATASAPQAHPNCPAPPVPFDIVYLAPWPIQLPIQDSCSTRSTSAISRSDTCKSCPCCTNNYHCSRLGSRAYFVLASATGTDALQWRMYCNLSCAAQSVSDKTEAGDK
jgi:hypothetical protein